MDVRAERNADWGEGQGSSYNTMSSPASHPPVQLGKVETGRVANETC